jgi:tRNA (guanine-N7-)-methyltransferase
MFANSRAISTTQTTVHPRLREVVLRHLAVPYRRHPSAAGRAAFAEVSECLGRAPFLLDAGCGTGQSTFALARANPGLLVLGVDKSAARLAIGQGFIARGQAPANAVLLRCDLIDFWQLASTAGLCCERQFLLHPNPWPKADQVKRRWHAHPILPSILALGGAIELRTNWRVYAEEFALSLRLGGWCADCAAFTPDEPLTPFERKYAASGHALCRCIALSPPLPLAGEAGRTQGTT